MTLSPAELGFEENIWVIAKRAEGTRGQWVAHCLNLDIISISFSLEGALRAAAEAVKACLRPGSAPLPRRKALRSEWSLVELLVREGAHGQPPAEAYATAAAQLRLVQARGASPLLPGHPSIQQLPLTWLDDETIANRRKPSRAALPALPFFKSTPLFSFARRNAGKRNDARCGQTSTPKPSARGITMSTLPEIIVTTQDFDRLQQLVSWNGSSAAECLDAELARAQLVAQNAIPADVVTMNSDVVYEDASSGEQRAIRLVYPKDAEATRGWVSVLAPIGSALLGLRQGQEIDWPTPSGKRRLRVIAVPYQPERSGDFAL